MLLDYVLMPLMSVIYMSLTVGRFLPEVPYGVWLALFAASITAINLFGLKVTNRANFVMTAIMSASVIWFFVAAVRALHSGVGAGVLLTVNPFYNAPEFSFSAVIRKCARPCSKACRERTSSPAWFMQLSKTTSPE
jgi:amino acid permease